VIVTGGPTETGVNKIFPVGLMPFSVGPAVTVAVEVAVVGVVAVDGLLVPAPPQAAVSAPNADDRSPSPSARR
jgi:hypothetical protein